jgi:carbamoyltransferase
MKILGLHFANDAAAALVDENGIVAAVAEERFARVKHHAGWPGQALQACLKEGSVALEDLDAIAFSWNPALYLDTPLRRHNAWRHQTEFLAAVPGQVLPMLRHLGEVTHVEQRFELASGRRPIRIFFVTHHLAHAASSFYVSPFDEAAVLTLDGYGERTSVLMQHGRGVDFEEVGRVEFPHSLGGLYAAVTQYLGFRPNSGEGKVMGLASYGKPKYLDDFRRFVKLLPNGGFELDLSYFGYYLERPRRTTQKFIERFGPERAPESEIDERHKDIAASLQACLEEVYDHLFAHLHRATGEKRLCMAGGVTLNCVANGRCFFRSPFEELFLQPSAGDNGTALGAALYVLHKVLGAPRRFVQRTDCWGPSSTDDEIARELRVSGIEAVRPRDIAKAGAALLAQDFIIGWYQGRAEFGPRALGSRSILADPRGENTKDVVNARVKFREFFRPFAPSVLAEKVGEWFTPDYPSPFMLLCHDVREDKLGRVPAITHVDNTARIHSVERDVAPLYYDLIAEFEKLTGVPMILDTSFNIRGEPIVNTPKQALMCFMTTDMDFLFLGGFLLWKNTPKCKAALERVLGSAAGGA